MCGVLGVFGPNPSIGSLDRAILSILNRGPDSHSIVYPSQNLVMGASRLAMTDPHPRSNQPFGKGGDWLVFNGEIYNYKELRDKLKREYKVTFGTESDTEVLLEVLRCYGPNALREIRGMFAFVYFENQSNSLLLGRDELGKKPLYISVKQEFFYWASTIPALQELTSSREISFDGLLSYLLYGFTLDPRTIYSEVFAVAPGHCYRVTLERGVEVLGRISTSNSGKSDGSGNNLASELEKALNSRIDGHEKVAVSLSGGLDSSLIAKLLSQTKKRVTAYSLFWKDSDKSRYNLDYEAAKLIAQNLGIGFVGVDFGDASHSLESNLIEFVNFMGEPNSNPTGLSLIPLYKRIASDGFRLLLTGDGSDEIFGGYPRYRSKVLRNGMRPFSGKLFESLTSKLPILDKPLLSFTEASYPGIWSNFHWNFKPIELERILSKDLAMSKEQITQKIFDQIRQIDKLEHLESNSPLAITMKRDSLLWLANESNRKLDRISMAYSIEARSPFQDENVINAGIALMRSSHYKKLDKQLLWDAFPGLTDLGVRREKVGFISPLGHWLRRNPAIVEVAMESLLELGHFRKDVLFNRRRDQYSGDFNKIRQLWSLVVLGYWIRSRQNK